jgi:hypothetical protein
VLAIRIGNRYVSIQRHCIWDAPLHHVDPMMCDACQSSSFHLHLCTNGHLACSECVQYRNASKREFCALCRDDNGACAMRGQPLRAHSLIRCPACGKVTCQEH